MYMTKCGLAIHMQHAEYWRTGGPCLKLIHKPHPDDCRHSTAHTYLLRLPKYSHNEDLRHEVMNQLAHAALKLTQIVLVCIAFGGGGFIPVRDGLPFPVEGTPPFQAIERLTVDYCVYGVMPPCEVCS